MREGEDGPMILDLDIGRAMHELAKMTGAYTHRAGGVERPIAGRSEQAQLIVNALRRALLTDATLSSACGGSAVLMAQPFVLVDSAGEVHGRPDMVAFALQHSAVLAYISKIRSKEEE